MNFDDDKKKINQEDKKAFEAVYHDLVTEGKYNEFVIIDSTEYILHTEMYGRPSNNQNFYLNFNIPFDKNGIPVLDSISYKMRRIGRISPSMKKWISERIRKLILNDPYSDLLKECHPIWRDDSISKPERVEKLKKVKDRIWYEEGTSKEVIEEHIKPDKPGRPQLNLPVKKELKQTKDNIESFEVKTFRKIIKDQIKTDKAKNCNSLNEIRRNHGVSDTTINHELRLLRHAYNLAIREWELVNESPFSKISIPRGNVKRVRYLSDDEEVKLFGALPEWLKPIIVIARETGLRLSNILNLTWTQVNLNNKAIIVETTKNGEPIGLPMTENVFDILKTFKEVEQRNSVYVFINQKTDKPFCRWWVSKSFRKVCRKVGIENFRFHDLRHDFCSKLVQKGVDLYTVAALAGHKDIKMTQRYAHLHPDSLRSAISIFNG